MVHGGDIYRNDVDLDFSVNVNPLGIPEGVKDALREAAGHCMEYPDISNEQLRDAIEKMTGMNRECILCGNGASELLMAVLRSVNHRRAGIPVPSFGGYEYAAEAAGCERIFIPMQEAAGFSFTEQVFERLIEDIGVLLLANPNNPSGNMIVPKVLETVIKKCQDRGIIVVLDECFIEFTGKEETHSVKYLTARYPHLIVIRAFTKIYAIPGVRLGYLFCGSKKLLTKIQRQLSEWNVSVFAQAAGIAACAEKGYKGKTAKYIGKEREHLAEGLRRMGIHVYPSQANFLLLKTAFPLYEELLKSKILIRDCESFRGLGSGFYRIAVKTEEENAALLRTVAGVTGFGIVKGDR